MFLQYDSFKKTNIQLKSNPYEKVQISFSSISLISINSFAQKNEIKVMYSPLSLQRMDGWGKDLDGLDAKYMGTFMIDYNRYVKPRLKVGINVAYDHEKVTGTKPKQFAILILLSI